MKQLLCLIFLCFLIFSCQNGKTVDSPSKQEESPKLTIIQPQSGSLVTFGDSVRINWVFSGKDLKADSLVLYVDDSKYTVLKDTSKPLYWNSANSLVGNRNLILKAYTSKGVGTAELNCIVLSDIKPKQFTYKVLKVYPHSRESYTQGLIYDNGIFYESAGEYGKSALKKVSKETGAAEIMERLESNIFAEGIAVKGNEIFQITWKEQICIVYELQSFQQKRRFSYEIQEGWGLEYDGSHFLMTDGSNIIYYLDPESFTTMKKVEVMDNNGSVRKLNELELVNGFLYANIYMTDNIVKIDPNSGKVLGYINFTGLLPDSDRKPDTDVLNGIAFDSKTGHFFVTGKKWPKLFEIEIF